MTASPVRVDEVAPPPDYPGVPAMTADERRRFEAENHRLEMRRKHLWTASELMATDFPPMRFAIPGLVAEGLTLLGGKPKLGKSWLALGWAVAVASGGVALSRRVEAGATLYLALEDSPRRIQGRLSAILGPGSTAPSKLTVATAWPFLEEGGEDRLEDWLTSTPAARLIVIDTAQRIRRPGAGRDRYAEDYQAWARLQELALRHETAIVAVHHMRKDTDPEDWIDSISGSTGITGAVDTIAALFRERGSMDATLRVTGRDLEDETDLALKFADGLWSVLGSADEYRLGVERAAVLKAVDDLGGEVRIKDLSEILGKSVAATSYLVIALAKDGFLKSTKRGYYRKALETLDSLETEPPLSSQSSDSRGVLTGDSPDEGPA